MVYHMEVLLHSKMQEVTEDQFDDIIASRDYERDNYSNSAIYYWTKPFKQQKPFAQQWEGRFFVDKDLVR